MGEDVRAEPFDIPGYRIMRWLGRGGMADVYLAMQLSLGRPVAIKVLAAERTPSDDLVSRFEQEARIVARLDHPHIVGIFDVGRTSTGQLYYTMPHMPNGDLAARDLTQDQRAVLDVVRAICQALAYAHEQGIVHRDVKPENVLFDKLNRPLLADFGIALTNVAQIRVTREGSTLGSVAYMSPEQARGRPLDGRSDIYSLGVVCYECLAGKLPFSGEDSMAVALAHVEQPVPHLPPARLHWQSFIDKALAKKPEDRFQSAQEMLLALDTVATRLAIIEPLTAVAATLATMPERLERGLRAPVQTRPNSALAIVGLGVAILVGGALYGLRTQQTALPPATASAPSSAPAMAANPPSLAPPAQPTTTPAPIETVATAATNIVASAISGEKAVASEVAAPDSPKSEPAAASFDEPFAQSVALPQGGASIHDRGAPEVVVVPAQLQVGGKMYTFAHAFALGRYEVTRGEYAEFARATSRPTASCRQPGKLWSALERLDWRKPGFAQDDRHPAVCVSWDDANAYVQWLSKRTHHRYNLPSQAEWLHASRTQSESNACKRGNVSDASNRGFLHVSSRFDCSDGFAQTAPIGRFLASSLGIHDLLGNASEWTRDCEGKSAKGCRERVFRGLSWHDGPGDHNLDAHGSAKSDVGYNTVGFRVLREIEPDDQFGTTVSAAAR
jgi:serine/threonine-protein kinase PpkA